MKYVPLLLLVIIIGGLVGVTEWLLLQEDDKMPHESIGEKTFPDECNTCVTINEGGLRLCTQVYCSGEEE